jgi:AraC family transcriptional regulator
MYQEFRQADEASVLAIEGIALELAAAFGRASSSLSERHPPRWLVHARELLHARFSDPLSLSEIAAEVHVHPVHLARVFRRVYGSTVGEYVRRLRVEFASQQLLTSDSPLSAIAHQAGFSHQSHFSTTFKRFVGATPAEYRFLSRRR